MVSLVYSGIMSMSFLSLEDTMRYALSKFISIPSISADISHKEDCRQGAIWLKKCLGQLGAHTALVSLHICQKRCTIPDSFVMTSKLANAENTEINHVVLATFKGSVGDKLKPRILFYGCVHFLTER